MKTMMTTGWTWAKRHPLHVLTLFCWGLLCGVLFEAWAHTPGIVLGLIGWVLFCLFMWRWPNKVLGVVLAASFVVVPRTEAQQQFQPAAPLIIGGIIIIVGGGLGIAGCKAVKRCKRIAAAKTNLPPEEMFIAAGLEPEFGAAFFWPEPGTCYEERLLPSVPTVTTMCPVFDGSNTRTLVHADVGPEFVQTWQEFEGELWQHGLALPQVPVVSSCYSRNRHPCEAAQVPITLNWQTHTAKVGAGGVLYTFEKSENLIEWETVLAIEVEPWRPLRCEDVSETGSCFYRVTTREVQ